MRYILCFAVGLVLPIAALAQSSMPIVGTWSLVSLSEDHHGQITRPIGDKPQGQALADPASGRHELTEARAYLASK